MHFPQKHPILFLALKIAIGSFLVLSIAFLNEAEGHTINCGEQPNRKAIKEQLYKNRKPLNLKLRPGDIFSRGALEELKDRKRLRKQRVNAQTDHIYQKRMVVWDRCIKHAYDHEEWHAAQSADRFTPFGNWAIPEWCVMAESGGQNIYNHSGSGASGYYQIIPSTWNGFGGYSEAIHAPKAVQDEKAFYMYQADGLTPWHACS